MFKHIFSFELWYRLKKVSTYIYFALFFLAGFFGVYRASVGGGLLRKLVSAGVGNVNADAPYVLFYLITVASHFGILITAAFFTNAAFRDFKENSHELYFSYPVRKIDYFAGRFFGALAASLFVFSAVGFGAFLGRIFPFTNADKVGPVDLWAYIQPYLVGVLPNILFAGALFFSLVLLTRKFFPVYVGVTGLLVFYSVGESLARTRSDFLAALIDPFGKLAAQGFYEYWAAAQKNILLIPLSGNFLLNRVLWSGLAVALLIFTYRKFRLSYMLEPSRVRLPLPGRYANDQKFFGGSKGAILQKSAIATVERLFGLKNHIRQVFSASLHEFRVLVKNTYFLVILFLGTTFIFILGFRNVGLVRGTQAHPVTSQVLASTQVTLYLFSLLLILFCSGELVWRERSKKVDQLYDVLPAFGYDPYFNKELADNDKRGKYGLQPKEIIASINDTKARRQSPIGKDALRVNYEAVVSTSEDQTALTSGELIKEWQEGDRRYFHYRTGSKILKYFSFLSAKYCVKKDKWQDIDIEIYYHKSHDTNIDLMIKGVKKSLEYYSENFSPYQFKQVKIAEFPKDRLLYAEGFPNLIPFSEGYGFIAKFDGSKVEYVFRVTAHEVSHQWWGHQVMGGYVEGMFLLSEGLAQYSALMVSKKEYPRAFINEYIKTRIDHYLRGRARETRKEVPLALTNFGARYINYEKSMVVMNALQDYIGEDNLNAAIGKFLQDTAFREPPFPTSMEFLEYVKAATPPHLKYILTDMFETITLYENKAVNATYEQLAGGKYRVILEFAAEKIRADGAGNEKPIGIKDYITFGVFGDKGEELYLQKHLLIPGTTKLEFVVDKIPEKAGIDPYYYLIDKNTGDNVIQVRKK